MRQVACVHAESVVATVGHSDMSWTLWAGTVFLETWQVLTLNAQMGKLKKLRG